jgi:hypothetical protein
MGFFSKDEDPRWVDSDDLKWSPEAPLFYGQGFSTDDSFGNHATARPDDEVAAPAPPPPRAARLWLPRLVIGLAQGIALFALLQSRSLGQWPGSDGYIFAALSLALLFAPLLLLEGLGEIPLAVLGLWTAIAAAAIACMGLYHHWRIEDGDQAHAGLALVTLIALALVIAQAWLRAGVRDKTLLPSYRSCSDLAWTLGARLLVWATITACAWAFVGSGNSLVNWLRAHYPDFHPAMDPARLILPLVGVASAVGFSLTAGGSSMRRLTRRLLLTCLTIALPLGVAGSIALVAAHLTVMAQPLWAFLSAATLLLVAFNASYRAGARRGLWRRGSELAAAFLMVTLCVLAALALRSRVLELGWTPGRIYAALAILFLGLYGTAYCFAGLISIGGGRWMQRVESANRALAVLLLGCALLLCTPLADPLQLAVKAQAQRLAAGADPAAFDFVWLRRDGVRFGRQALLEMTAAQSPEVARDAAVVLSAAPGADAPPPSQIGANITVRTPGARMPETLLRRDWSKVPGAVPPCLTRARLSCDAWFMDLDRDGTPEILLVYGTDTRWWASVMKRDVRGDWNAAASFASPACRGTLSAMRKGDLYMADPAPTWQDLLVAGFRLTAKPGPKPDLPCPH